MAFSSSVNGPLFQFTFHSFLGQDQCRRGHQRKIETPRKNQKRYGAGLIHWVSGKLYWATSDHKDNALFRAVLSQVLEPSHPQASRKMYVVIDTYRIHFAKPVLALLAAHAEQIE